MSDVPEKKLVLIGDEAVGKTSLLLALTGADFRTEYRPTVYETYTASVELEGGRKITLSLSDTAGQVVYDRLRPLAYMGADAILICFNLTNLISLHHVTTKWIIETAHFLPDVPIFLIGTKADLRTEPRSSLEVLATDAQRIAEQIGAVAYLECSSRTDVGVVEIFKAVAQEIVSKKPRKLVVKKKKNKKKTMCRFF